MTSISVVIPAKNEASSLGNLVKKVTDVLNEAEVIVVDDGSDDETAQVATEAGAHVISHPYSIGNGAAIKTGVRHARGELIVFMDADGQHQPEEIPKLLEKLEQGFDLAIGARDRRSQASFGRYIANSIYNKLASWITNVPIADLTSGFRAVRARKFKEFLYLLPNGFSYPTTSTMAFLKAGYSVVFVPVTVLAREGKSHINLVKDGARFFLIIFKVGTLYSPLKVFVPIALANFVFGIGYYIYTYVLNNRFTNMGVVLMTSAMLVFLVGLVSEQITTLIYRMERRSSDYRKNDADR